MFPYIMPVFLKKPEPKPKKRRNPNSNEGVKYEMKQNTVTSWPKVKFEQQTWLSPVFEKKVD